MSQAYAVKGEALLTGNSTVKATFKTLRQIMCSFRFFRY
jgi:hypothetical protein